MELVLQILLAIISMICLAGGANLLLKGAGRFLPEGTPPQPTLDNLFRFLSGIYFSMGFLVAWVAFNLPGVGDLIYFVGVVVMFSGLGRLYSKIKVGTEGRYLNFIMMFEIGLGIVIVLLQYLRTTGL